MYPDLQVCLKAATQFMVTGVNVQWKVLYTMHANQLLNDFACRGSKLSLPLHGLAVTRGSFSQTQAPTQTSDQTTQHNRIAGNSRIK